MGNKDVAICSYPKSGNTWISRLLGDALNSPVTGIGSAHPIAEEGLDRTGPFVVRQLHLRPDYTILHGPAIHNAWTFAPMCCAGEKMITILRDPRDVAVSVWKYWEMENLEAAIRAMGEGLNPLKSVGPWAAFVTAWLDCPTPVVRVWYEDFVRDTIFELSELLSILDLPVLAEDGLFGVVERQAFANRKKELAGSGSKYMYGESIQLKNMRKGIAGDWRNHFTPELHELAIGYFGKTMERIGYDVRN